MRVPGGRARELIGTIRRRRAVVVSITGRHYGILFRTAMREALLPVRAELRFRFEHRGERHALRKQVRLLERTLVVLEHEDEQVLETLDGMAQALGEIGNARRARSASSRAVAGLDSLLGPQDPVTIRAQVNQASLRALEGDDRGAALLGARALSACRQHLQPDDRLVADTSAGLGATYARLGRLPEAADLLADGARGRKDVFGRGAPTTIDALTDLFMVQAAQRDQEAAEATRTELRAARRILRGAMLAGVDLVSGIGRFMGTDLLNIEENARLEAIQRSGRGNWPRRPWLTLG